MSWLKSLLVGYALVASTVALTPPPQSGTPYKVNQGIPQSQRSVPITILISVIGACPGSFDYTELPPFLGSDQQGDNTVS